AFFLDPDNGRRRRHTTRDRVAAFVRRRSRLAARKARYVEGVAHGVGARAAAASRHSPPPVATLEDVSLARKVETEIFRPSDAPKGQVDVNVENGIVYLRGQVDRPEHVERLAKAAGKVEGVQGVENLLHLPGAPAPA